MDAIERNDCIYTAEEFYDPAIGYLEVMRTATIDRATEVLPARGEQHETSIIVLTTAELADCTCPDWCERDHDRD
jgi:hypothetical protein